MASSWSTKVSTKRTHLPSSTRSCKAASPLTSLNKRSARTVHIILTLWISDCSACLDRRVVRWQSNCSLRAHTASPEARRVELRRQSEHYQERKRGWENKLRGHQIIEDLKLQRLRIDQGESVFSSILHVRRGN